MNTLPLQKNVLLPRMDGITEELEELKKLRGKDHISDTDFAVASFHLQHVLEGILNISSHILSRVAGTERKMTRYQDIVRSMGGIGVVPNKFAQNVLIKMAGYRNRLVHHYAEITKEEIKKILRNHLGDCKKFLGYIKKLIEHPKKFGFKIE